MKMPRTLIAASLLLGCALPAFSADKVILTIKGAGCCQGKNEQSFTLKDLAALPQSEIITQTPWTKAKSRYQGVSLAMLLKKLQITSSSVKIRALNDYWAQVPVAEIDKYKAILATHADGKALTIRNKGPVWLMLPLSEHPEINKEQYHSYMVWQVHSVEAG
ncbi:molybdopterin-dependent oxidoreductase [Vogesella fluminis]|uniref:Molybdopterin-binding oxidoreductase n=1 Tax=Vogesella fluminis TaxID=1069161 RepID=A0ABQ3H8X7_9NEIS|nr:molybdopterin-dependent oxidoreductase [Vogesella fluminis]GHD76625.1 molybdopterin-binding oxidoreductase [Vogesella fluminis]